jgi:carboxyl-terminal processing protease
VVKELIPGGPADLSKQIKPNDKITAIAQDTGEPVDVIGMKLRNIVQMIRGTKGTNVSLTIESGKGATATRKVVVLGRDIVNLDSARAHAAVFSVPASDGKSTVPIGVITLPGFYGPDSATEGADPATASKDVAELIKRMQADHIQGLVLDLRQNGGGLLSEAVDLTGLFIKSGPVVQVNEIKVDSADAPALAWSGPLAVLTSRFSASASEIVAGALQNYGRAIIVGDSSTHGKGTVQTIVEMSRAFPPQLQALFSDMKTGAAKLTIQKFYLPNGSSTQLKGVIPDIILPSVDDYLPIGESSLPHALGWDEIPPSKFDGHALDPGALAALRAASTARQAKLPEFSFLQRSIAWFKARQDQKDLSLNLKSRQQQMDADAAYKKTTDAELKKLEKSSSYAFTEVMLAPPPPPRIKAASADPAANPDDVEEDNPDERYTKMDIDLRESLRVVQDAIHLNPEPRQWVLDTTPTTPANPVAGTAASANPVN